MLSNAQWTAIALSLQVATVAVVISLPLALAVAWVFARYRFPGKTLLETVVNLPLVVPPVVTGYVLLQIFGRRGWLGEPLERLLGIQIVFDWKGAALASAVVAFPLLVRSIRIGFAGVDRKLEQAARTLGASRWRTFATVTLPLARRGMIAGCVLAFARSLGEFGATMMVAGNLAGQTQTIALFIYTELQTPGGESAAGGVIAVSIAIAAVALLVGEAYDPGRLEREP